MASRQQNEAKFATWQQTPDGGRVYGLEVRGRHGWTARYLKQVDREENTLRFWQEIYDEDGKLIETHQKFPVDTGHQRE